MPPGLEARILRAVRTEAARREHPAWRRALSWLLTPRAVRVSPAAALVAAGLVGLLLVAPWDRTGPAPAGGPAAGASEAGSAGGGAAAGAEGPTVYVEFILEAPEASSVSLAGDFNGWAPDVLLQDGDGDGVWSARVRLEPGVHKYMFVVDGSRWVADPYAERYVDDGFGNRNAVLAVLPPGAES